jgi:hypothetical protein
MSDRPVDFDALVGDDLEPGERARLLRVHEMLLEAGPPPELTPELRTPRDPSQSKVVALHHRRRVALVLVAAVLGLAVFGAGWLGGSHSRRSDVAHTIPMAGPGGARASLAVLEADSAGNWPMVMKIRGLAPLPAGQTYALWLTKDGKLEASCGTFAVGEGTTTVNLNAPFHLKEYDGWIVVRSGTTQPLLTTTAT